MKTASILASSAVAFGLLFLSTAANSVWTSYVYLDSDAKNVHGIQNGDAKIRLGTSEKKANRAAKKLNKQEKGVMAGPNGEGDLVGHGELPR